LSAHLQVPRLSVSISTYKRADGLRRLLDALRPQVEGRASRSITVVNDGSHDTAYDAVARNFADVITYRALPENVGIARARNAVAAQGHSEFIVYTDDDCVPPSWWLDWLEARLDANPELDVVIGTTRPQLRDHPRFIERVNGHYNLIPAPHGTEAVPLFVTANVAIRRALFERLGGFGFSEWTMSACEDTELASRLAGAAARTVVDLQWYVSHDVSDGLVRQMRRHWRYGFANVQLSALTTAPDENAKLARADRGILLSYAAEQWRENLELSEGFSRWRAMRWVSAAAASCVRIAFYAGCVAAVAERRRELRL
jgi:GT2 family glycosyltransferase